MPSLIRYIAASLAICAGLVSFPAAAAVSLPNVISNHMVLQRDIAVPIWGTADPNEKVTVTFRDQKKTATADAQGKWMVKLDPLKLGDPATLTVSGSNTITLADVLVGDVWIGSGQSNIDSPVQMYAAQDPALKEAASASSPRLRLCRNNGWQETKPDVVSRFSAQLFYFGMLLQKELGVPVGVIECAKGGMASGVFISQEGFKADPDVQTMLAKWDQWHPFEAEQKSYEVALEEWKTDIATATANAPSDASNSTNNQPALSSTNSVDKAILAKFPRPKPPVRAADIQTGGQFEILVRPIIPYAIRGVLWDQGESYSGIPNGVGQSLLMPALIRSWRKDWGQGDFPWIFVQKQNGGGCALNPSDPVNLGAKPFEPLPKDPPAVGYQFVEGFGPTCPPNTFLAITSDLVPGVHPINKSGYATRDSIVALGAVYGKPVEYYGPVFQSFKVEGDKIRISYTHLGKGLTVPANQKLQGFAIAGEDKKFHWADAVIDGATVVLSSPDVGAPVAARYWPAAWANLFNLDGLPALGFQTDSRK